jgi:hypothetical protein
VGGGFRSKRIRVPLPPNLSLVLLFVSLFFSFWSGCGGLRAEPAAAHGHVAAAHFRLGDGVNLCGFLRLEDYLFSFLLADGDVISKGLTLMGLNNYMCAQFLTLSPGCLCFSDGPF